MKSFIKNIWAATALLSVAVMPAACSEDNATEYAKYPAPTITSHFPDEAFPTGIVTITGSEFGSERTERIGRVYFGGVEATEYVSWTDNEIQVRVPDGAKSGDITLWVWKNNTVSNKEFNVLPSAVVKAADPSPCYPNTEIELNVQNLEYFIERGVTAEDITVEFPTESTPDGIIEVKANSMGTTSFMVMVPDEAKGGEIYVSFGDWQRVKGPSLSIIGDIPDYDFILDSYVMSDGSFSAQENYIESTKRGAYMVYEFTVPVDGNYDVFLQSTTNQGYDCLVNIDMGTELNELANRTPNTDLYQKIEKLGWANMADYEWGTFSLRAGKTYYMRIYLWAEGTSWVCNITNVKLKYMKKPTLPVIDVDGSVPTYNLYQCDFNGDNMLPFAASWAWDPCYIKATDNYAEFYYNAAALQADNRRERRGCELTCDFGTPTEGWYGFKVRLPEGRFPMDESGIIIAQLFNKGCKNSWAGHLSIDKGELRLSYRNALIDPSVAILGKMETDKWYDVVLYFKVGRNGKGNLKAWFGETIKENEPTYDSGTASFGFGHWIDDETLDNTGNNVECASTSDYGGKDYIGCKFGLYVSNPVDITLHMDNIKALESNPAGAFSIVKP